MVNFVYICVFYGVLEVFYGGNLRTTHEFVVRRKNKGIGRNVEAICSSHNFHLSANVFKFQFPS